MFESFRNNVKGIHLLLDKKKKKGEYSSIGRTTVCGTVSFLFKSEYPPLYYNRSYIFNKCSQDSSTG